VSAGFLLSNRYKVAGGQVFDTFSGKYVNRISIESQTNDNATKKIIGDFSKVTLLKSYNERKSRYFTISCRVENRDTVPHNVYFRAKFYDKDKNPLFTDNSSEITLGPGDIKELSLLEIDGDSEIASYDVKLEEENETKK
jgi:hypothetical protein